MRIVNSGVVGVAVALFIVLCPMIAWASIRSIPNVRSESPSGRYRFDAVAPHNDPKNGRQPPLSNFTCTLVETTNSRTVWTWKQDGRTSPPTEVWVDDSGWVVIRTLREEIQVIEPETGRLRAEVSILETFPRWEEKKFVVWSTAGPIWEAHSRWYFFEHRGELHFAVRTYWGRRVVIRLHDGKQIAERPAIRAAAAKAERDWAIEVLRRNLELFKNTVFVQRSQQEHGSTYWDTWTALWILGMDKVAESTALLREAEVLDGLQREEWVRIKYPNRERLIDPDAHELLLLRAHAQLALRRIGEVPRDVSAVMFAWDRARFLDPPQERPNRPTKAERTAMIRVGMTPEDVVRVGEEPDRADYDVWEYHVDGDSPYTVRVIWECEKACVVSGISRISPPTWVEAEYKVAN